jgi:hypothetical protein
MSIHEPSTFKVFIDDNYHYMDEEHRRLAGEYPDCEAARAACRRIVDRSLRRGYRAGMSPEKLLEGYKAGGEDAWIQSTDPNCKFSSWTYAKERCQEICRGD